MSDYTTIKLEDPSVPIFGSIRRFSDPWLDQTLSATLASLPPSANFAIVAHVEADATKGTGSIAAKLGDHWSIVAGGYKEWIKRDGWAVGCNIVAAWP